MLARRLIVLLITTLLATLAVVPAAAAPSDKFKSRTTSVFLNAFSPEDGVSVFLFREPEGRYVVCVSTPEGSGCASVDEDAVQLDERALTSATLGPVTIPLEQCDEFGCEPTGDDVTVAVTFTGTGELTTFKSRFKSSNGCKVMGSSKGVQRQGEATITIDGATYDAEAFLTVAQETFTVQCKR